MVGRRTGSLVAGVMLVGVAASCGPFLRGGGHPLTEAAPDTVALPSVLPSFAPAADPADSPLTPGMAFVERSAAPAPTQTAAAADAGPGAELPTPTVAPEAAHPIHPALRRATLQFTGDTLVHSPVVNQARANHGGGGYDFTPMFERVRGILSAADLALCHLESPMVPEGEALSTAPQYGVPPEVVIGLAYAGYDRCSTASNHTIDRGTASIDATVNALEASGLSQAGMARTPEESVATLVTAGDITIAHLSYTFSFNGARLPRDEPWRSNLIDAPTIIAAAIDARARGAEVVVVNLHWGTEGSATPNPYQRQVADELTRAGVIDLIVGEHAHVIQPIEQVNGTWVVFGMGNFLSNMPTGPFPPSSQDGMIVSVTVAEQADGTFAVATPVVVPTWVDRNNGFVIRPVLQDLDDPAVSRIVKDQLYASLQRTGAVVGGFVDRESVQAG